jgi:hypothetical protein
MRNDQHKIFFTTDLASLILDSQIPYGRILVMLIVFFNILYLIAIINKVTIYSFNYRVAIRQLTDCRNNAYVNIHYRVAFKLNAL